MQTKDLIINGKLLARYQHNGDAVWIKPYYIFKFLPADNTLHFIAALVSEIENTRFDYIGMLE